MPSPTAQNGAAIFRAVANLAVRRFCAASFSTSKKKKKLKSPSTATASAANKNPSAHDDKDAILKEYVSTLNVSSATSRTAENLLKSFKSTESQANRSNDDDADTSLYGIVNDSLNTGTRDYDDDEEAKQLHEDASRLLCDKMDLGWDDYESEEMSDAGTLFELPWLSKISNTIISIQRKEVDRERKQKWIFKSADGTRFGRVVNTSAQRLGSDTALEVFGRLGHKTGLKEYNALIKVCMEKARSTTDEEVSLQEIHKAYLIFKRVRETGFKIEEEMYRQFLMYAIDFGMVEEFFFFSELLSGDDPDTLPRLAYYEMLLWVKVNNEEKIQELCHSAVAGSDEKSYILENYFLALCESNREQEILMLLEAIDINKVTSVTISESIFRSLGKLMLDSYVERFLLALKGSDTAESEDISNLISEYVISRSYLAVDDIISKFKAMHSKFEVLPTAAQYEKLIKYSCQLIQVHEALNVVDEAFKSGIEISLEMFHLVLDACYRSSEFNLVHHIKSRMSLHNVKPNTETLRRIVILFVKMKDFEGAYKIIDDMRHMNLAPTSEIYNAILAGYFREKNFHGAINVLKQMEDADVKPNSVTYSHLINNSRHEEDIDQFYSDMCNSRVQPTKHVFKALVNAYASCGQFEKARKILLDGRIPKKNLNEIKNVLVGALASNGQVSNALTMYEEIKEAKCDNDPKATKTLIEHLQFEGKLDKSLQLLEEIYDSPYWTDACFDVIAYCVQKENLRTTVDLLKKLNDKFINSDVGTEVLFDEVFSLYEEREPNNMRFGLDLLEAVKELGVLPSRKSLDFLLSACVSAKDSKAAFLIWKEYEKADLPYNVLSYVRMYEALSAAGDHKSASSIQSKIPKDDPHVSCVVKACKETFHTEGKRMKKKKAILATLDMLDRLQATTNAGSR